MITVTANARNLIYASDDIITSGSVGIPVVFDLSEDFDGLSCVAVFEGSGVSFDVPLMGANEKTRGIADSTLEGTRQVCSAYFNWLQREGLIRQNPTANLGAIKCAKKIKDTYSDIDIERLKRNCATIRDRAIIAFLGSTGCRISEMTQLNRNDVDLASLEYTVLGKGNKERTVYLTAVAGMLIREYLGQRTDDSPALFAGKGTERISPQGVRAMLVKLAGTANVDHVHPHKFRRTLATNLIRHGMPIQEVSAILGHDKLDTTMEYVVLDKTEVKHSYHKYA